MKKTIWRIRLTMSIVLLFTAVGITTMYAQNAITVSGNVKSDTEALPGVSISIKGATTGTITDFDGNYVITTQPNDTLVYNFIGFKTVMEVVNNRSVIDVLLEEDLMELDEVIAIGYGSVRKKDLTGAISTVKGDELSKRNVSDVAQALQGQLAGVQVSSNGGAPGEEAGILIRGVATINDNKPLYVVDDIPLDDISWLNPKDIENVQVLKDASSSAIFGSRASNGVVIIQTKQAVEGKTIVTVDATFSVQNAAKKPSLADATEYAHIANKAALNSGQDQPFPDPESLKKGTDWWDQATHAAPIQNYSVTINKGTKDLKISSGLSYFKQEGVAKGGEYERLTLRLNTEYKLNDWITVGQNLNVSKDKTQNGPDLVWDVQRIEPTIPVYLPEYEWEGKNEFSIFQRSLRTDVGNPMGNLARNFDETDYLRTIGNLFLKLDVGYGFSAETKFAFFLSLWENNWFSPDYYIGPTDFALVNQVSREHNNRTNYTWNNLIHYNKKIANHDIKATAGFTMESYEHRKLYGYGSNLPNNNPDLRYLDTATEGFLPEGTDERNTLQSFLARVNYSYKDKYLITASFRADGSSRFAEENRWGYFPAVAGAWNVKEEPFMSNIGWMSQLKLRGGWGQVGNQNIENNALLTFIDRTIYVYGAERNVNIGMAPSTIGNSDLIWETVEDFNVGTDLGFFNQELTLSFDYFEKKSKDMLMEMAIPFYLGGAFNRPYANVGTLNTKGFEIVAGIRKNLSTDLKLNASINLSQARSKITQVAAGEAIWSGNHQRLNDLTRTTEGDVAGSFYGWVTDGIFQNESEVINYTDEFGNVIQPLAQPGDMRFKDLNGDGTITDEDRKVIGNPEPDFSFGVNINLEYKNFDLSMLFNGTYGNDVLNAVKPYTHVGNGGTNSYAGLLNDAWDGEGSSNSQPRLATIDGNNNFRYSDFFIEDGSYIRLRSAQIGYNLPSSICQMIHMNRARFFVGGENLFTVTNFSGLDPDLGGSALERGIDWGQYPLPRIFMIGANITF
ncbi:TonB-dependent receptor [Labilibacter sediminis]|nr:TonB-dependent receptor [Labilibacter sediminis]